MHCCQFYWSLDDSKGKKDHCFEGSVGKNGCLTFIAEQGWNLLGWYCTVTILADENGLQWKGHSVGWPPFSFVLWGKSCLGYHLPLRGDCKTGQRETHLQMRNKEVCFAYQLLTTSRVAFGCCLWFCRCLPSNGSRVMDPFPRKLHWNILTVTFA